MIQFKVAKRVAQMVFERIDTLEYAVVKGLFAQIVPEMFNGIELGRVWWKCEQAQVVRQSECSTLMPPGAVENHHDALVGMARADLIEKQLHAGAVDVRQYQRVEHAIGYRDGRISVGVLLRHHCMTQRTNRFGAPATPRIGDATEARFVLKHQPDRPLARPRAVDFEEDVGEFFFQASWAATSALGCRLSGASLRQP